MIDFLASFSSSFLIALIAWPFIAALLTLPVLIVQYRRFNRIHWSRIAFTYLLMLYGLGLLSFTLYPMPDNPVEFCRDYSLAPQLMPLMFVSDITNEGLRAILQVVMNIVFFVPLGVFVRLLFRWKFMTLLITGVVTSLAIETAQLTGVFGLYPCSYRLFDIDDLMFNTLGAMIGYLMALLIPRKELEYAEKGTVTTNAGAVRRLVAFIVDGIFYQAVAILITIPLYLIDKQSALDIQPTIIVISIAVFHFALPFLGHGKTLGGHLTRMTLDDKPRSPLRRPVYYLLRLVWIGAFLLAPSWVSFAIGVITVIVWLVKKRLPYVII